MGGLLSVLRFHGAQLVLSGGTVERGAGCLYLVLCRSGAVDGCQ
jgi:hypothetical protein